MKNYGLALKNLREYFGLTQREIADKIGVSNHAVSKWENGVNQPDVDTLRALCAAFGVSMEQFFRIAAGESVERVLGVMRVKEEVAYTARYEENEEKTGAGTQTTEIPFKMPWWIVALISVLIIALTVGIILLSLGAKGDTLPSSSIESSESVTENENSSSEEVLAGDTYEIRYYVNGGLYKTQRVEKGSSAPTITAEQYGYTFQGWYTDESGKTPFDFTNITSAQSNAYALFTPISYTVEFINSDNGDRFTMSLTYGQAWTFPMNVFTKDEYILVGWSTGDKTYSVGADGVFLAKKEGDRVVLTAVWQPALEYDYKVYFTTDWGEYVATEHYRYVDTWTVSQCFLEKIGYTFAYWECNGQRYDPGYIFSAKEGTEYHFVARYTQNRFYIHYKYGNVYEKTITYLYDGENFLRSDALDGARDGYYVSAWIIDGVTYGANEFIGNLSAVDGAVFVATPIWELGTPTNYTFWFESGYDGAVWNGSISIPVGGSFTLPDAYGERAGYEFAGWLHLPSYTIYKAGDKFTLYDTREVGNFVAQWKPLPDPEKNYEVRFVREDGMVLGVERREFGEVWSFSQELTLKGYTFDYWLCNGKEYRGGENFSATEGAEYVFVAHYKPNTFYIEYRTEDYVPLTHRVTYLYDGNNYLRADALDGWKDGYYVSGWTINGQVYTADAFVGNLTDKKGEIIYAYPIWSQGTAGSYTLYFGGYTEGYWETAIIVNVGNMVIMPTCHETRKGYIFAGWKHKDTKEVYQEGDIFAFSEAYLGKVFEATWKPITFTIVYQSDDPQKTETKVYEYDRINALDSVGWNKNGYILDGWEIDGVVYSLGSRMDTFTHIDGKVFYAKAVWRKL